MAGGYEFTYGIGLNISANTEQAKQQIAQLKNQLNNLLSSNIGNIDLSAKMKTDKAIQEVSELTGMLNKATTASGTLDLSKFTQSLTASKRSVSDYANSFKSLGVEGQKAFLQINAAIASAEKPLIRVKGLLDKFVEQMIRTTSIQISYGILNAFTGTFQKAFSYAEKLDRTLNDIRIVTGQSNAQMEKFAQTANATAKKLSTSTTDYTQAALIFYQQGLSDEIVKERTDITIKMANASGEAAKDISSYMTAIWNNFDDGSHTLEYYADVISKLGADTAASNADIAKGMQAFSAVADTVGLSFDYASSALALLVDKTQQSADKIGNSLKTIFARLESVKMGDTLEDGVGLTKYTAALEKAGVHIIEADGNLKNMDTILDELGEKWKGMNEQQKMAIGYTVAGVNQYNNFISLLDNYDDYVKLIDSARHSTGELNKEQAIYAESWQAAKDKVEAAAQGIYQSILDDDFFKDLTNLLADVLTGVQAITDGFGGMKGLLLTIGTLATTIFKDKLQSGINLVSQELYSLTTTGRTAMQNLKQESLNILEHPDETVQMNGLADIDQIEVNNFKQRIELQRVIELNQEKFNVSQQQTLETELDILDILREKVKSANEYVELMRQASINGRADLSSSINNIMNGSGVVQKNSPEENPIAPNSKNAETMKSYINAMAAVRGTTAAIITEEEAGGQNKINQTGYELLEKTVNANRNSVWEDLGKEWDSYLTKLKSFIDEQEKQLQLAEKLEEKAAGLQKQADSIDVAENTRGAKKRRKSKRNLETEAENARGDAEEARTRAAKAGEKYAETLEDEEFNLGNTTKIEKAYTESGTKLVETEEKKAKVIEETKAAMARQAKTFESSTAAEMEALELNQKLDNGYRSLKETISQYINEYQLSMTSAITNLSSVVMQMGLVISTVDGMIKSLSNPDTNAWEKLISVLSSMAFMLPTLISLYDAFTGTKVRNALATIALTAAKKLDNGVTLDENKNVVVNTGVTDLNTAAKLKNAAAIKLVDLASKALKGSIGGFIAPLLALAAVIGGIIFIVNNFSPEGKLKKLREQTEKSAEAAQKARDSYKEVKDAINSLDELDKKISGLTKGTQDWVDATKEAASTIKDLVQKYGLKYGVDWEYIDGVAHLTEAGRETLITTTEKEVKQAENQALLDKIKTTQQEIENINTDIGRKQGYSQVAFDLKSLGIKDLYGGKYDFTEQGATQLKEDIMAELNEGREYNGLGKSSFYREGQYNIDTGLYDDETFLQEDFENWVNSIVNAVGVEASKIMSLQSELQLKETELLNYDIDTLKGFMENSMPKGVTKDYFTPMLSFAQFYFNSSKGQRKLNNTQVTDSTREAYKDLYGYNLINDSFYNNDGIKVNVPEEDLQKLQLILTGIFKNMSDNKLLEWMQSRNPEESTYNEDYTKKLEKDKYNSALQEQQGMLEGIGIKKSDAENLAEYSDALYGIYVTENKIKPEDVKKHSKAMVELAAASIQAGKGLDDLEKNYNDWYDAIKGNDLEEKAEAFAGLHGAIQDMLNVSDEAEKAGFILDDTFDEFLEKNEDTVKAALAGHEWAWDELRKVYSDNVFNQLLDDASDFYGYTSEKQAIIAQGYEDIYNSIQNLIADGLQPGELMLEEIINGFQDLCNVLQLDEQQANLLASALNMDAEVSEYDVPLETVANEYIPGKVSPVQFPYTTEGGTQSIWNAVNVEPGHMKQESAVGMQKVHAIKVDSLRYNGQGGKIAHTKPGGTGRTPAAPKGGSKSTKTVKPKKVDTERERYYEINKQIQKLTAQYDMLNKAKDRAHGKKRLKLLDEEISKNKELLAAQKQLLKEENSYMASDKSALQSFASKIGVNLQFDEGNNLINGSYEALLNAAVSKHNSYGEDTEGASEFWDEFKKVLGNNDATVEKIQQTLQDIKDKEYEIFDQVLEGIKYNFEYHIDIADFKQDRVSFLMDMLDEDKFEDAAEKISLLTTSLGLAIDKTKQAKDSLKEWLTNSELHGGLNSAEADTFITKLEQGMTDEEMLKWVEKLGEAEGDEVDFFKDLVEQLEDNAKRYKEILQEINEILINSFDNLNDRIDKQSEKLQHVTKLLNNYKNVSDLLGRNSGVTSEIYNAMNKAMLNAQTAEIKISKQTYDAMKEAYEKALLDGVNEDTLDELRQRLEEAEEDYMQDWEDGIQMAVDNLAEGLSKAAEDFGNAMAGAIGSLDQLTTWFDRYSELNDKYLDKYEKAFNLTKLSRELDKSINDVDDIAGKKKLKSLMEEINALNESDSEISEYELEVLQKRYDLYLAEIALRDAEKNKSSVRMVTDAEGNRNYAYVANQEQISQAQQAYDDALFAYADLNENQIKDLQENYKDLIRQKANDIADLGPDASAEDIDRINEYYDNLFQIIMSQMQKAFDANKEVAGYAPSWDVTDEFDDTLLSQLTGQKTLEDVFRAWMRNSEDLSQKTVEYYENYAQDISGINEAAGITRDLTDEINDTIALTETTIGEVKDKVDDVITAFENAFKDALDAFDEFKKLYDKKYKETEEWIRKVNENFWKFYDIWLNYVAPKPKPAPTPTPSSPSKPKSDSGGSSSNGCGCGSDCSGGCSSCGGNCDTTVCKASCTGNCIGGCKGGSTTQTLVRNQQAIAGCPGCGGSCSTKTTSLATTLLNSSLDTGGYTGEWGSTGKIALLHEKELVLNKDDTANMLAMVNIARDLIKSSYGANVDLSGAHGIAGAFNGIEQNVVISAEFPNAVDHYEIEQAFNDLLNRASQYANRKK